MRYFPPINAYGAASPGFYEEGGFLLLEDSGRIAHASAIKNLVKAYAWDDKLFIEGKLIVNPGHRQQMQFLGLLANVKVPCDGGKGQHPVVVEYDCFFKDDIAVYHYYSKTDRLEQLSCSAKNLPADDYGTLIKLKQVAQQ